MVGVDGLSVSLKNGDAVRVDINRAPKLMIELDVSTLELLSESSRFMVDPFGFVDARHCPYSAVRNHAVMALQFSYVVFCHRGFGVIQKKANKS
jgi:hypothetical protein